MTSLSVRTQHHRTTNANGTLKYMKPICCRPRLYGGRLPGQLRFRKQREVLKKTTNVERRERERQRKRESRRTWKRDLHLSMWKRATENTNKQAKHQWRTTEEKEDRAREKSLNYSDQYREKQNEQARDNYSFKDGISALWWIPAVKTVFCPFNRLCSPCILCDIANSRSPVRFKRYTVSWTLLATEK